MTTIQSILTDRKNHRGAAQATNAHTTTRTSGLCDVRADDDYRVDGGADSQPSRRVLMISCAFPPTGGPGVQRSAKFAKYLPACGWQPVVWAAERMPDLPHDPTLLSDLPRDLCVRRVRIHDPRARLRDWREHRGWRWAWYAERFWTRMLHHMLPDPMVHWAIRSYRACRRLIDDEGIDALYSTYSPASNHLLAWWLHGVTGLPWVADFRDLWTDDYGYPYSRGLRRHVDRALERAFIRAADAVVAVTDGQRALLSRHDPVHANKFVTIANGVDLADFARVNGTAARRRLHGPNDRFVLTFTGWFLSDRVSSGLIEGITRMGAWAREQNGTFVLRIVGRVADDMRRRFEMAGVTIETPGYVPHAEAIAEQLAADVLLLLVPEGPNGATLITGKIFEYLASTRPILLVAPPGPCEAASLLRRCRTGTISTPDADAVFNSLRKLWTDWHNGALPSGCSREHLTPLTREHLAARLGEVLTGACTTARGQSAH